MTFEEMTPERGPSERRNEKRKPVCCQWQPLRRSRTRGEVMAEEQVEKLMNTEYAAGFHTPIESDTLQPGLNEDVVRFISAKKNEPEWMLEWRLQAFRIRSENVNQCVANGDPSGGAGQEVR